MKKIIASIPFFVFLFAACNNGAQDHAATSSAKTAGDSLWNLLDDEHMKGMKNEDKLTAAQANLQKAIDSIGKLPAAAQKANTVLKVQLDSALNQLKTADVAMKRWMSDLNIDSAMNESDKRVEYLIKQKAEITSVNEMISSSLQKADSLLKK
ncbi:MAG: hypothetical protein JSU05_05290 [Bacteroidetes bacterium]|nr:hypothetical protein [Bacteroidota bacterium]